MVKVILDFVATKSEWIFDCKHISVNGGSSDTVDSAYDKINREQSSVDLHHLKLVFKGCILIMYLVLVRHLSDHKDTSWLNFQKVCCGFRILWDW